MIVLLEIKDLYSGYYPEVNILNGVSLSVDQGKITSLIGPNGCGKSTLLRTIFGWIRPKRGEMIFDGLNIADRKPHELMKLGILLVPQLGGIFPDLSILDNLLIGMWTYRDNAKRVNENLEKVFKTFPILEQKKKDKASTLSGGQQKLLEFSRTFLYESRLALLDEPTAGLSPKAMKEVLSYATNLREKGIGVLLVDQNIKSAVEISDYIYSMSPGGTISKEGSGEIFRKNLNEIVEEWIGREV